MAPLDFSENPRKSAADPVTFTPESTTVEIRRAFWARPFEGWWITERPPAEIDFDSAASWLSKDDQSRGHEIIIVLRPKAPAPSSAAGVLRSQLTFRNKDTGEVFERREVTLRTAGPVGNLSLGGPDVHHLCRLQRRIVQSRTHANRSVCVGKRRPLVGAGHSVVDWADRRPRGKAQQGQFRHTDANASGRQSCARHLRCPARLSR